MVPAAMAGAWTGRGLLARLEERWFLLAFRLVLAALAAKMILWAGCWRWRAEPVHSCGPVAIPVPGHREEGQ
jgi:hypothetical protein